MHKATFLEKDIKILVVDDSEFSRKNIAKILETEGLNVVGEASTAQETTEILGRENINIFIIDVVMPDISGIELARHLKDHFNNIYIIMISSLTHESIILEAITAGAADFLFKPFSNEDLLSSVMKIIEEIKQDDSF